MAAKNAVVEDAPAVVERPAPPVVVARTHPLVVAGIAVGAVVIAGLLFGGGVLVGTHIPTGQSQSQFGPGQGAFPGGPDGMGGPGPVRPGQDDDSQP